MKKLLLASAALGAAIYGAFLLDQHLWLRRMSKLTASNGFDVNRSRG